MDADRKIYINEDHLLNSPGATKIYLNAGKRKVNSPNDGTVIHLNTDSLIAQFNGAKKEHNMGERYLISPWVRDEEVSSKNSNEKLQLSQGQDVVVKEGGLYLIYAQVAYLTHAPNVYMIWARQTGSVKPRLLSICATGDDSSRRALDRAQITCAVQTVVRLYAGDTVNISQRDANRTLLLQQGYSYFGFVKLGP